VVVPAAKHSFVVKVWMVLNLRRQVPQRDQLEPGSLVFAASALVSQVLKMAGYLSMMQRHRNWALRPVALVGTPPVVVSALTPGAKWKS
jgi:hypothetical protein